MANELTNCPVCGNFMERVEFVTRDKLVVMLVCTNPAHPVPAYSADED